MDVHVQKYKNINKGDNDDLKEPLLKENANTNTYVNQNLNIRAQTMSQNHSATTQGNIMKGIKDYFSDKLFLALTIVSSILLIIVIILLIMYQ
jgi:hypothetical protein